MDQSLPRRIGLNLLYLVPGKVGGTEIYARELIGELARALPDHEFIAYCGREAAPSLAKEDWPSNVRIHKLPVNCANKPLRILVELFLLPLVAARHKIGLLHSLGTTGVPYSRGARAVTVHDLIYHHHPESVPRAALAGLEFLVPFGAKRSHVVLADSMATKLDLVDTYAIEADSIDVVYLGFGWTPPQSVTSEAALRERLELGDRQVVLCVAAALAHKNIPRLFEAFATVETDGEPPLLVVSGHAGLEHENWKRLSEELGIADRVRFTGWVEDEDLEGLYELASVFAYPTLFEGFGLPILEAMQRGTPVVCSNATSLPEVAGDAALMFDPLDVAAIGDAISRVLNEGELARQLVIAGVERAKQFTWRGCAETTIASYRRAVARKSKRR